MSAHPVMGSRFRVRLRRERYRPSAAKPKHPWTNEQIKRMNRTTKEATVRRYHCGSHGQLQGQLAGFSVGPLQQRPGLNI